MRCANANRFHRKSGGAKPRDLQFSGLVLETFFLPTGGVCGPRYAGSTRVRISAQSSFIPYPVLLEHSRTSSSPNPVLSRTKAFVRSFPDSRSAFVPTNKL